MNLWYVDYSLQYKKATIYSPVRAKDYFAYPLMSSVDDIVKHITDKNNDSKVAFYEIKYIGNVKIYKEV